MAAALRARIAAGCSLKDPICVYDLAERLGVEVRFFDIGSMDGMYCFYSQPVVILSSMRPAGRRAFTCAHELGHHYRCDGMCADAVLEPTSQPSTDPKEFAADCFAGALLMPKVAIDRAFSIRGWSVEASSPGQIYRISCLFGVGYTTIVNHLRFALHLLSPDAAEALLEVPVHQARVRAIGWNAPGNVLVADEYWVDRAIDAETSDLILAPADTTITNGTCIEYVNETDQGVVLRARQSGIGRIQNGSGWSAYVRVSRKGFVGRSLYRHWEDVPDE